MSILWDDGSSAMNENRNERLHRYLDGELARKDLTSDEQQELARYEQIHRETQKLYKSTETPDLTSRIMEQLTASCGGATVEPAAQAASSSTNRLIGWLWAPRPIRLRPAYGVAFLFALMVAAFAIYSRDSSLQQRLRQASVNSSTQKVFVQFRLDAPEASVVQLLGSFTGWKPAYTLQQVEPGVWSVMVPLAPGVHDYAFIVNGHWKTDPAAPAVDDGFGGANSRLLVVQPDGRSHL